MTLRVLTYNVQLFPDALETIFKIGSPFSKHMHRSRELRIKDLVSSLRATNADIVALQEIWDIDSENTIAQELQDIYPYVYVPCYGQKGIAGTATGHMLLSKHATVDNTFVRFKHSQYVQSFVRSGFYSVGIVVQAEDGRSVRVRVFGTHMQAYPYARTRQSNLQQLMYDSDGVLNYRAQHPTELVIVLGDFNINATGDENAALHRVASEARLYNMTPHVCKFGDRSSKRFLPMSGKRRVCDLDFIFASLMGSSDQAYTDPETMADDELQKSFRSRYLGISDHVPLLAIVPLASNTFTSSQVGRMTVHPFVDAWPSNKQILCILLLILFVVLAMVARKKFEQTNERTHERTHERTPVS